MQMNPITVIQPLPYDTTGYPILSAFDCPAIAPPRPLAAHQNMLGNPMARHPFKHAPTSPRASGVYPNVHFYFQ
jgi:hypothetical protein